MDLVKSNTKFVTFQTRRCLEKREEIKAEQLEKSFQEGLTPTELFQFYTDDCESRLKSSNSLSIFVVIAQPDGGQFTGERQKWK